MDPSTLLRSINRLWKSINRPRSEQFYVPDIIQPVSIAHVSETTGLLPYMPDGTLLASDLQAIPAIGSGATLTLPRAGVYRVTFFASGVIPLGGNIICTFRWVNAGTFLAFDRNVFGFDVLAEISHTVFIKAAAGDVVSVRNSAAFAGLFISTVSAVFCGLD